MRHRSFAGGFAELAPQWVIGAGPELCQFLAHQRAYRLVACYGSVFGIDIPRGGLASVGDVAESLMQRSGAGIALLHGQFGPVQASGADPLLSGLDQERADPA